MISWVLERAKRTGKPKVYVSTVCRIIYRNAYVSERAGRYFRIRAADSFGSSYFADRSRFKAAGVRRKDGIGLSPKRTNVIVNRQLQTY